MAQYQAQTGARACVSCVTVALHREMGALEAEMGAASGGPSALCLHKVLGSPSSSLLSLAFTALPCYASIGSAVLEPTHCHYRAYTIPTCLQHLKCRLPATCEQLSCFLQSFVRTETNASEGEFATTCLSELPASRSRRRDMHHAQPNTAHSLQSHPAFDSQSRHELGVH